MPTNPSEDDGISVRTNLKVKGGGELFEIMPRQKKQQQTNKKTSKGSTIFAIAQNTKPKGIAKFKSSA